ncbi:MAG: hypothetical protein KIT69_12495, partial [Propionibacteriaceae bacterium]|nr:hypothetical protein [Propionibacteriaceae bacterium]
MPKMSSKNNKRKYEAVNSLPNYTNLLPKYDNTTTNNTITNNNNILFNYIVNTTNDRELKTLISQFNNTGDVISNLNTIKKLCIHYTTISDNENLLKLLFVIIDY